MNVTPKDEVKVHGEILPPPRPPKLWLANKLPGEIVKIADGDKRRSIFSRLQAMGLPPRLKAAGLSYCIDLYFFHFVSQGRLDWNSEGMLLFTDDGDLARLLEHPNSRIPRRYFVLVEGRVVYYFAKSSS